MTQFFLQINLQGVKKIQMEDQPMIKEVQETYQCIFIWTLIQTVEYTYMIMKQLKIWTKSMNTD